MNNNNNNNNNRYLWVTEQLKGEYSDRKWHIIQATVVCEVAMELDHGVKWVGQVRGVLVIDHWELGGVNTFIYNNYDNMNIIWI
jgi:hypothetical protein